LNSLQRGINPSGEIVSVENSKGRCENDFCQLLANNQLRSLLGIARKGGDFDFK
jgi:hypothetical protein